MVNYNITGNIFLPGGVIASDGVVRVGIYATDGMALGPGSAIRVLEQDYFVNESTGAVTDASGNPASLPATTGDELYYWYYLSSSGYQTPIYTFTLTGNTTWKAIADAPAPIPVPPSGISLADADDRFARIAPFADETIAHLGSRLAAGLNFTWLHFGDSISDATGLQRWVYLLAKSVAKAYPNVGVNLRQTPALNYFGANTAISPGNGSQTFNIWNAAIAGTTIAQWMGSSGGIPNIQNLHDVYIANPDLITIMLQHNESVETYEASITGMITAVAAMWPNARIALIQENPHRDDDRQTTRRAALSRVAAKFGLEAIHHPWYALGGPKTTTALYTDALHPTTAGQKAIATAMGRAFGLEPANTGTIGVFLTRTSAQTYANGAVAALDFPNGGSTEMWDTDGFHDPDTNSSRITIPAGAEGFYRFTGQIGLPTGAAGNRDLRIMKNGTTVIARQSNQGQTVSPTGMSVIGTDPVAAVAGDYYELWFRQDSGANLAISTAASPCTFEAERRRATSPVW